MTRADQSDEQQQREYRNAGDRDPLAPDVDLDGDRNAPGEQHAHRSCSNDSRELVDSASEVAGSIEEVLGEHPWPDRERDEREPGVLCRRSGIERVVRFVDPNGN